MSIITLQGMPGSFSEAAAEVFAKSQQLEQYTLRYAITSSATLHDLSTDQADIAIIAIKNTRGGLVLESLHALAAHQCSIMEIFSCPINQSLLIHPDVTPEQIKSICSHPQALRQCREFLAAHFPNHTQIEAEDTAIAAKNLSSDTLNRETAVIAHARCATLYGLKVMSENIQDDPFNSTTFLSLEKKIN